ncbi:unnamed protein product [Calypogeia fissa]
MSNSGSVTPFRVVLILALVVLIQGHWEDSAHHHHDRNVDVDVHPDVEMAKKFEDSHHLHDHDHQHDGGNIAQCEKQSGNCVHEHEGEEAELEGEQHHHHQYHRDHAEFHSHSHEGSSHRHGEAELLSHSHSDHDNDGHSEGHHHDHGEESQVESQPHSHNGHSSHSCPHASHHHHHDEEHLTGEKVPFEKFGHVHSHGEEDSGFHSHSGHRHEDDHVAVKKVNLTSGVWLRAMGCSLLVSLASLVCLLLLPLIVIGGRPSRTVVDALAGFGAGCMLGDALLHQLPHAFSGGSHSHTHSNHGSHDHHSHEHGGGGGEHAHGHSLEDLSVGLAVLAGILLFFLVEKIVRRTEELSVQRGHSFGHGHHHHHHRVKKDDGEITQVEKLANEDDTSVVEKDSDSKSGLRKRNTKIGEESTNKTDPPSAVVKSEEELDGGKEEHGHSSNFVLSYLNLFSDGVHNFTDGMALGSAFLLHGTVGGWSRTLFLLAHELPQEVGDFGMLLRSGFGVFEALAFNFLSALMALVGTAVALLVGGNPGHSSLIEGFTAGGFIYIAVGAVMPDMHSQGNSLRTTLSQLAALSLGMGAAILISLAE